jgi:hypothetical protein
MLLFLFGSQHDSLARFRNIVGVLIIELDLFRITSPPVPLIVADLLKVVCPVYTGLDTIYYPALLHRHGNLGRARFILCRVVLPVFAVIVPNLFTVGRLPGLGVAGFFFGAFFRARVPLLRRFKEFAGGSLKFPTSIQFVFVGVTPGRIITWIFSPPFCGIFKRVSSHLSDPFSELHAGHNALSM